MNQLKKFPGWIAFVYFVLGWLTGGFFWLVWIIHYIIFKFAVSGHNARVHREERDRGSHIDGDA